MPTGRSTSCSATGTSTSCTSAHRTISITPAASHLFVAGFIGSPAMNLVEGTIEAASGEGYVVEFGDIRLRIDDHVFDERPSAWAATIPEGFRNAVRPRRCC